MNTVSQRPGFFELHNGSKSPLPFPAAEYERRIAALRQLMSDRGLRAILLTSMHNVAYYSDFCIAALAAPTRALSPKPVVPRSLRTSISDNPGGVVMVTT